MDGVEEFPERPNALHKFLHNMHDAKADKPWNISMFHYRNHGSGQSFPSTLLPLNFYFFPCWLTYECRLLDLGKVLIGIQVPPSDYEAFNTFLEELGYPYKEETDNAVYKKYLRV